MRILDISLADPADNILLDDALWVNAEKNDGGEVLRFWESPTVFVVLGRIGKEKEDLQIQPVLNDRIPVLRRTSGGGTVLQGPGCINYSLILNKNRHRLLHDLRASYEWISGHVIEALSVQGCQAVFRPISDIALHGQERKFSGNAQRRGKNFILHHGTILYQFDLSLIERYLKMPKDIPDYRRQRDHRDFIVNIPINPQQFKRDMAGLFAKTAWQTSLTPHEMVLLENQKAKFPFRIDI